MLQGKTQNIVACGLLTAISVVFTRLLSFMIPIGGVGAIRLGFGPLPIIMAGIMFGPAAGGAVGMLADVVGYAVNPMGGAYIPWLTITAAMTGIVPGVVMRLCRHEPPTFKTILMAVTAGQFVSSIVLTPYVLYKVLHVPIWVNIPLRVVAQCILIPTYSVVIYAVQARVGARARAQVCIKAP
ncbi:MAG: folate family ECF transporter S component [Bacillota bacterium]